MSSPSETAVQKRWMLLHSSFRLIYWATVVEQPFITRIAYVLFFPRPCSHVANILIRICLDQSGSVHPLGWGCRGSSYFFYMGHRGSRGVSVKVQGMKNSLPNQAITLPLTAQNKQRSMTLLTRLDPSFHLIRSSSCVHYSSSSFYHSYASCSLACHYFDSRATSSESRGRLFPSIPKIYGQ